MKRTIAILSALLLGSTLSYAQYDLTALQFSQNMYQSDARAAAVGNAYGALGANFISASINPAGLGLYRGGEFVFSLGFLGSSSVSDYLDNSNTAKINMVNVPSMGLVFTDINKVDGKAVTEGWVSKTFAMGINRSNSFYSRQHYSGNNTTSSMIDFFVEDANGELLGNLNPITKMAFETWLIDYKDSYTSYFSALGADTGIYDISQSKNFTTKGSAYDMTFAVGTNYSNKIYVGGKIGIPFLDYYKYINYTEENLRTGKSNYLGMEYKGTTDVNGVGINAGLGIIFKPVEYLRIGASVFTPTFYNLSENYKDELTAVLDTIKDDLSKSFQGSFKYNLATPFRATVSAAVLAGKYGFVSVDYEYVDYSSSYLSSTEYPFNVENSNITDYYKGTGILRAGAEIKLGIFALRGGYGRYSSPYKEEYKPAGGDRSMTTFSFGGGIREKSYYLDLAYTGYNSSEFDLPYALEGKNVEGATFDNTGYNVILTFGAKF